MTSSEHPQRISPPPPLPRTGYDFLHIAQARARLAQIAAVLRRAAPRPSLRKRSVRVDKELGM